MSQIIGFMGSIGSGKSASTDYMVSKHKHKEHAFAKPLKELAQTLGFKHKEVYGTQEEKMQLNEHWGITGRTFMQNFATQMMREMLPDVIPTMDLGKYNNIWIKLFEIHITELKKKSRTPKIVVSDLRFPDEADAIKTHGGFIIKLIRSTDTEEKIASHASETAGDEIEPDFVILNDTDDLADLHSKIDNVIAEINMICKKRVKAVIKATKAAKVAKAKEDDEFIKTAKAI